MSHFVEGVGGAMECACSRHVSAVSSCNHVTAAGGP